MACSPRVSVKKTLSPLAISSLKTLTLKIRVGIPVKYRSACSSRSLVKASRHAHVGDEQVRLRVTCTLLVPRVFGSLEPERDFR